MSAELKHLQIDRSQKHTRAPAGRTWLWPVIVIAVIIVSIGIFFLARSPAAIEVQVVHVAMPQAYSSGDIALSASGYIVAAHKIELAPKVSGRAEWVGVEMGDKVKKGQELVRLEDKDFAAQVRQQKGLLDSALAKLDEMQHGSRPQEIAQAKADLEQAQATLKDAKSNFDRILAMGNSKAISQQLIDDAEANFGQAKGKVDSAQAAYDLVVAGPRKEQIDAQKALVEQTQGMLDLAKLNLADSIIRSPIDGTILDRHVEVGNYVTTGFVGDSGAKGYVVSLADLNDLKVELDISQSDFNKVAPSQHCVVRTEAYPDLKYEGVVDQISPEANRQKATVLVKVKILNPDDHLKPEMNANVGFISGQSATEPSQSVIVPASAVRDGKVFVVEEGKAVERTVQTGQATSDGIHISRGLGGGENVIIKPPADLRDGRTVKVKE